MEKRWYFYILILALLCTALYFPGLGARDLWNPNEPNFSEAAREMMESGNYIVPTRNGEPLGMKPAPYYWLIIASSHITGGLTETAARLPSALFGLLTVLLVFCLARRVMEDEWAFITALFFATTPRIMWQARWVEADMTLLFFITLCLYLFFRGFESLDNTAKKRLFFICGYAAAAGAVLQVAERLYAMDPEWVVFFREVLGVDGIVRRTFSEPESLPAFWAAARLPSNRASLPRCESGGEL